LYDLLLLLAHAAGRRADAPGAAGAPVGQDMLALLDRAEPLRQPTTGYHRLRGAAYRLAGDPDRAAAEERRAADPNTPVRAVDHFLAAESLRTGRDPREEAQGQAGQAAKERLNQAIAYYRQALAKEQGHFWSHFQIGHCYLGLRQNDLAVEALGACVALRPESPWGYTLRGLGLGLQKHYPEALADLDTAVRLDPALRQFRLIRGVVHWWHQQYDPALADFAAALADPPEQRLLEAARARGLLHLERGHVDSALDDFGLAVSEQRGPRAAYLRRAVIYFAQGDFKKGLADVESYLTRGGAFDPKSAAGHEARGRELRLLAGELPREPRKALRQLARAELEKAVALGGKNPVLFDHLGLVLQDLGQLPESVQAYGAAVALSPKEARLRVKRGAVLVDLDRYDDALADFTAALQLEPAHAEALAWVGYVRACQGKAPGEAGLRALEATLHGSGDYLVLHNIACIYGKLSEKEPQRAREYEDLALACLYREVELWRKDRKGPDPIPLIRGESAFPQSLKDRPEFKKLITPSN
jgi:tetratricopeptide (TPR) repeat protein